MVLLIRLAKWGTLAYLIYKTLVVIVATYSLGEPVKFEFFSDDGQQVHRYGITPPDEEAHYGWFLYMLIVFSRVIYLYGFYRLWQLFSAFEQKQYFAGKTIQHLKIFSGCFLVFTALRIIVETSYLNIYVLEPGNTEIVGEYWGDLFLPVLFFIVAHVLNEARKNEEEMGNYF
ncbi:DUF2975 domain-containing protein [Kordiimonas sp. SCSIO 12610]|uniref:DUF2975 domain-containing protein n=1 Tax=Kordiimonas sp. SCSIO 12610 TaxID=2829597 RepID=UPI00210C29B8|nr:DUF2975 domain-containing protein [Kordiimonas sp. SCSIO 12610]UTW56347.1 DUF2975 domain-containing protein [Kordiimonas sp. SCSIO 12610]